MRTNSLLLLLLAPLGVLSQQRVSNDASCGGTVGFTCRGSAWGNCCSKHGWCGSSTAYCGTGCQSRFGNCNPSIPATLSTPSPVPQPIVTPAAQKVSNNARCGSGFGSMTCLGSKWGNCCSQYSYCGSTVDYCAAATCQKGFGKCDGESLANVVTSALTSSSSSLFSSTIVSSSTIGSSSTIESSAIQSSASSSTSSAVTSSSSLLSIMPSSTVVSLSSSAPVSSDIAFSTTASSTTVISSTTTSSTPSPSVCPYYKWTCTPLTIPLLDSCGPYLVGHCNDDFALVQCKGYPAPDRAIIFKSLGSTIANGEACTAACLAESQCAYFTYKPATDTSAQVCNMYSKLGAVVINFDPKDMIPIYAKRCKN